VFPEARDGQDEITYTSNKRERVRDDPVALWTFLHEAERSLAGMRRHPHGGF